MITAEYQRELTTGETEFVKISARDDTTIKAIHNYLTMLGFQLVESMWV